MKTAVIAAVIFLCAAASAFAGPQPEVRPYFAAQYFTWSEYDSGGARLLKESGPLVAAGARLELPLTHLLQHVLLRSKAELFGGKVNYSGQTQGANPIPVDTDVIYFGVDLGFDVGPKIQRDDWYLYPFAGLDYRGWYRMLQDSTSGNVAVSGYTEDWETGSGRFGIRYGKELPRQRSLFVEGGAKYPFYVGNTVEFVEAGKVTFRPRGLWSAFGEVGFRSDRLEVAATYEGFRYAESPQVIVRTGSTPPQFFFQPDSDSDIWGLRVGLRFP